MSRTTVGVLRGGTSPEYEFSLKTGAAMLRALPEDKYDVRDILIDKNGLWHSRGVPVAPARALSQVDVALNALHGGIGEDGTVARILERAGVPYTGSRPLPSSLALNKARARSIFEDEGIRIPRGYAFTHGQYRDTGEIARFVFSKFSPPYMVKPVSQGSSVGAQIAYTVLELPGLVGDILDAFGSVIVEEFVLGEEATVGVIEGFRGQELYVLPPALVLYPEEAPFLHFEHHTNGDVRHIVPSRFTDLEKMALMDAARAAHTALGLSQFSKADFILTRRGPYLLEVDALPHLHEGSAFHHKLEAVGSSLGELLEHIIGLAKR
jgi:D-alanine-D-alanine ligase